MKNPNDPIGNRTRDFPACGALPQPTVLIDHHIYDIFVTTCVELQVMEVCSNHPFYGCDYLTFRIRHVTDDRSTYKLCTIIFYC